MNFRFCENLYLFLDLVIQYLYYLAKYAVNFYFIARTSLNTVISVLLAQTFFLSATRRVHFYDQKEFYL